MRITATMMQAGYEKMAPAERLGFWNTWVTAGQSSGAFGEMPAPVSNLSATPYEWIEPDKVPMREWVYGRHYASRFLSTTIAPGGIGKSSLTIVEGLAIATERPLLGIAPERRAGVWLWNGEDPIEELQRRIAAACLQYGITAEDLRDGDFDRLFVDTGRERRIIIAETGRDGTVVSRPVVDAVMGTIKENDIGVMIVDPFVACHRVTENDNNAVETVVQAWAEIADKTGCAIELVHHARKTGGAETTVDDARGASALLAKTRSARVINGMTQDEADKADVENRRLYFRCENGKANLAVPAEKADWYRLNSIDLGNGWPEPVNSSDPSDFNSCFAEMNGKGDSVGVVVEWTWPDAMESVNVAHLREVQRLVAAGRYRENSQATDWVGNVVASVLRLDPGNKAARSKISSILKTWIGNRMFKVVHDQDTQTRKTVKFVEVDEAAT